MARIIRSLKIEFQRVVNVFLFFFVCFSIINLTETFLFKKAGIRPYSFLQVAIAAALVAKIFLVLDHIPLNRILRKWPLFYLVIMKTIFYWMISFFVRLAILFFPYLFLKEGLVLDWDTFFAHLNWRLFISIQCWYLMLCFLFVVSRELANAIGPQKMRKIFFGNRN